jgi:hypothetical protein
MNRINENKKGCTEVLKNYNLERHTISIFAISKCNHRLLLNSPRTLFLSKDLGSWSNFSWQKT